MPGPLTATVPTPLLPVARAPLKATINHGGPPGLAFAASPAGQ